VIPTLPHYIKTNEGVRIPRRWLYLDCEAESKSNGTVETQTWRLGCTWWEHRDNDAKRWIRPELKRWENPEELWEYVSSKTAKRSRTIVMAHNIGYDLRVSRGLEILPALGWELKTMSLGGRNLSMVMTREGATLVMADFMAWLPHSLDKVGTLAGYKKMPLPAWDADIEEWWQRCERDVEIMRMANRELLDWIENGDLGNWQKTGAGMSWAVWRHKHYTHKVLIHADPGAREAEVAAISAPRNEAWMHGDLSGQQWYEWDLPLAYPRIAQSASLPHMLIGKVSPITWELLDAATPAHRYLVRATVTQDQPLLPTHGEDGYLWPTGTFTGWYWDCELRLLKSRGGTAELHDAYWYRGAPVLNKWANWIIDLVERGEGIYSPIQMAAAKHWARALIGRFGAKYPKWEDFGPAPDNGVMLRECLDYDTGQEGKLLTVGGKCWLAMDYTYLADANPAIFGSVLAEARCRLWECMEVAGLENVAYVDTDSLVVNTAGNRRMANWTRAGAGWGIRVKNRSRHLEILGPRQLLWDYQPRISGLPRGAVPLEGDLWRTRRWQSIESGLASNTPGQVTISEVVIQVTGRDHRRIHLDGNATQPHHIDA
jgi:hypothetical protein